MSEKVPFGYKCMKCGKIHYPKHGRCLNCKNRTFTEVNLPSEGKLLTYTMLKAPPSGIDKFSLWLGVIDLGVVRYTGQLEFEDPSKVQTGITLESKWKKIRNIDNTDHYGFVWSPK